MSQQKIKLTLYNNITVIFFFKSISLALVNIIGKVVKEKKKTIDSINFKYYFIKFLEEISRYLYPDKFQPTATYSERVL